MKEVLIVDTKDANRLAHIVGELFGCWSQIANSFESAESYFDQKFDVALIGEMDGRYGEIYSRVDADRKIVYTTNEALIKRCRREGIAAIKNTGHEESDLAGVLKE
jgi:hypothetical protein